MKLMFALLLCVPACVSMLWPTACRADASGTIVNHATPDISSLVKPLADDPLLQTPVTLDVVEKPLGDVLAGLNPTLKLDVTAERDIADQRVTLHVTSQPLYALMAQLLCLFSHNATHPFGYHWGPLDRVAGERPDYQLWRDITSRNQEQDAINAPSRRVTVILQKMRDRAQLITPELDDPYYKALRGLTDDQIDTLVSGETIPLDSSLFSAELADVKHAEQEGLIRLRAQAVASGIPPPTPSVDPPLTIRLIPADQEQNRYDNGYNLDRVGIFFLYVDPIAGAALNLDGNSTAENPDPQMMPLPANTSLRVDLSQYLSPKVATPQQRGDLGFTLQALAKAAHLDIYDESFLRTSTLNGLTHPGLDTLTGSVPRLVAQICVLWNYHAQPIPGGYLFWSRTWAQDRAWDVPDRLIAPWRQRLQQNGKLTLYDRGEIDVALTWPQVAETLDPALPTAGTDDGLQTYRLFNFFGSLTPSEQTQALSADGLPVAEMSADGQEALAADYQRTLSQVPSGEIEEAVVRFQAEDDQTMNLTRVYLHVDARGQHLITGICPLQLNAAKTGTSSSPTS